MKNFTHLLGLCAMVGAVLSASGQGFLTNGLVGYYPFSGNANDASGSGNNAASYGALLATNRFGSTADSYSVANGSHIGTTNSVGFPTSTSDFTVSVWLSYSVFPEPGGVTMIFVNRAINQFQMALNATPGGNSGYFDYWTGGIHSGPPDCHTSTNSWILNRWYNLVVLRSQNTITVYRDGLIIGQSQTTRGNNATGISRNLDFGYRSAPGGYVCCPLSGQLDDIRLYNRALSPSELQQLYEYESGPRIGLIKAVKPSFSQLTIGANYQLQVSGDFGTWSNQGVPFTATSTNMVYPQYWDVDHWNQLFFRLQVPP